MKRILTLAAGLAAGLLFYVGAMHAGDKPGCGNCAMSCPMKIKGAVVQVTNTPDGVKIEITAKEAETIKKIQETAANCKDKKCSCMKGKGMDHANCPHKMKMQKAETPEPAKPEPKPAETK